MYISMTAELRSNKCLPWSSSRRGSDLSLTWPLVVSRTLAAYVGPLRRARPQVNFHFYDRRTEVRHGTGGGLFVCSAPRYQLIFTSIACVDRRYWAGYPLIRSGCAPPVPADFVSDTRKRLFIIGSWPALPRSGRRWSHTNISNASRYVVVEVWPGVADNSRLDMWRYSKTFTAQSRPDRPSILNAPSYRSGTSLQPMEVGAFAIRLL